MPLITTTKFDFSGATPSANGRSRTAVVRNETEKAVLHVAVQVPVPWVEVYPLEFALAPQSMQTVVVQLAPEQSRDALAPVSLSLFGQYLHVNATEMGAVPPDVTVLLSVVPPAATCPTCGTLLPEEARECRRCGERIRLCPVCASPNTWLAKQCRLYPEHVIRTQIDWLTSPGGDARHAESSESTLGHQLARRWSLPSFAPARNANPYEWSAPLAAFGLVVASAIDSAGARSFVQALEIQTGSALWDLDLPDPRGVYPDRGSLAVSPDGTLYAATLGGHVTAIDVIRGTLKWSIKLDGPAYGGVVVAGDLLLVPIGNSLSLLDRATGAVRRRHDLTSRLDTAPATDDLTAYVAADDGTVSAFVLATGEEIWRRALDGSFDAAPIVRDDLVFLATMAGTVYGLDAARGDIRWQATPTTKPIAVTPALSSDGLLYVAADDGALHVIAADSGNLIRSRRLTGSPIRTSPVCSGTTVFAGADDGNIYSLDADHNVHRAYETSPGARIAGAGLALYGDLLTFAATNGVLYVLQATG